MKYTAVLFFLITVLGKGLRNLLYVWDVDVVCVDVCECTVCVIDTNMQT